MPMATQKTDTGLTQGLLKVLHKQVSEETERITYNKIEAKQNKTKRWLETLTRNVVCIEKLKNN